MIRGMTRDIEMKTDIVMKKDTMIADLITTTDVTEEIDKTMTEIDKIMTEIDKTMREIDSTTDETVEDHEIEVMTEVKKEVDHGIITGEIQNIKIDDIKNMIITIMKIMIGVKKQMNLKNHKQKKRNQTLDCLEN